nr:hypothetical protein [Nonomuraea typhae]
MRQPFGIGHGAFAEVEEGADLRPVALGGAAFPVEQAQLGGGDLDLAGDEGDCLVR